MLRQVLDATLFAAEISARMQPVFQVKYKEQNAASLRKETTRASWW